MFIPFRLLAISLKRTECWKVFLDYQRSLMKLVNCMCRITFLEQCYQADIIPKFLKFRIPENGCFEPTVVHNFQQNLLKRELNKAKKLKETHQNVVHTTRTMLRDSISAKLIPPVAFYTRQTVKQVRLGVQQTHSKKLESLSKEQQRPLFDVHDTVKFCELDIQPPRYVIDTLAIGPKNAVLDKFDPNVTLAQIDSLLYRCKRECFERNCQ